MLQKLLFLTIAFTLSFYNQANAINQEETKKDSEESKIESGTSELKDSSKELDQIYVRGLSVAPDDMVIGDAKSKIVVVEYFSPTCPHCVHYHQKIFPEIQKKYIDTKKIAYVTREFIGNKQDLDATILARCDGNLDIYIKFINVILNQQDNWAFSKNYREILTNIGSLGGVTPEKFSKCLNDQNILKTIMDNTKLATSLPHFLGTPSFFINGKRFSERYTFEEISKALDKEINIDS
jgi:protein-disulfide isomerase